MTFCRVFCQTQSQTCDGQRLLRLFPPLQIQMDDASYRHPLVLQVLGHHGEVQVFSNEMELHLDHSNFSTFIQTDRACYWPGQEVKIRVVTLDLRGRPYSGPVDLVVSVSSRGSDLGQ